MSSPRPADLLEVFRVLNEFAALHFPGHGPISIHIAVAGCAESCILPVPACTCPPPKPADPDDELPDIEKDVLEVVDGLEGNDAMAWSFDARRSPPLPGCTHKSCANCRLYAARWYARAVASVRRGESRPLQPTLF